VGNGFRRAVPSPEPMAIVELRTIQRLVSAGVVVICAGGGGIPVRCDDDGALSGVDAVIDKDRSAALLASLLDADLLLYLTDVPAVAAGWGSAFSRPIERVSPDALPGRHRGRDRRRRPVHRHSRDPDRGLRIRPPAGQRECGSPRRRSVSRAA
jgi:carbamate kinase